MFQNLDVFRISHAMARHAGSRQAVIARNIANADTPGYAARDITPFSKMLKDAPDAGSLRASRTRHLHGRPHDSEMRATDPGNTIGDPNENTVSLEQEMLKSVEVKRQHDRAVAIYKSSLTVMRTALGRR